MGPAGGSSPGTSCPCTEGMGAAAATGFLSGERARGRFSREWGWRCSRDRCSGLRERDLRFLRSRELGLSLGRSRLLSRVCRWRRPRSRLLGGELPRARDPFLRRLCAGLPGLPERALRRPWAPELFFLSLLRALAFLRRARSRLLECSLDDRRLRAWARGLRPCSSPGTGEAERELLSPEWERERVLRCSLGPARCFLAAFLPRELDLEREREGDGDAEGDGACSSTMRWVVCGDSGSPTGTQVTVLSSEPKKELRGGPSASSQSSGGAAGPGLPGLPGERGPGPKSLCTV